MTTPASAFATWNVIFYRRTPSDILTAFEAICRAAVTDISNQLAARAGGSLVLPDLPVIRFSKVLELAKGRDPAIAQRIAGQVDMGQPLPENCRLATETVWAASGLSGPAVVTGFGSIPYLATELSGTENAKRLKLAVQAAAQVVDVPIAISDYFAGISDMSFFGEADPGALDVVAENTPLWVAQIGWPPSGLPAGVPTINIGPWGRDYHTPLERLHTGYAFETLPRLLNEVVSRVLAS